MIHFLSEFVGIHASLFSVFVTPSSLLYYKTTMRLYVFSEKKKKKKLVYLSSVFFSVDSSICRSESQHKRLGPLTYRVTFLLFL